MGTQIFFVSPQIANPEILGVIPQTKMLKNFECASPKIAKPQICED
jgi:hypothetical protein